MEQETLKQVVDVLQQITDLLYQENITPAYAALAGVLPQLEGIIIKLDPDVQQELTEKLQNALSAMEDGDNTLLADILQYEILEQLKVYCEE